MGAVLRAGIIGLGGFAGHHHATLARLEAQGGWRVVCGCDPQPGAFTELAGRLDFAGRGVRLFDDYLTMLDTCRDELDVVTIPTPIPLHAPMHAACVARGLPVYLEKPPTLSWRELEAMIAVEQGARRTTQVGFNHIVDPQRQATKARLLGGEFGAPRRVTVFGLWARPASYYRRASWAGRLLLDGRLVLDSPLGNAMAHLAHDALLWGGHNDVLSWGEPEAVRAELYRAHEIEGADTVFLVARLAGGVELALAMSHAMPSGTRHAETVEAEHACLRYVVGREQTLTVRWTDGHEVVTTDSPFESGCSFVEGNFAAYGAYLRGAVERPLTRLVDCRPFVALNNLAYLAAGRIATVPDRHLARDAAADTVGIVGLPEAVERFLATSELPSAQGLAWAAPGGSATRADLERVEACVGELVGAT